MNKYSGTVRVFLFALVGVALGIALSKLNGGASITLLAIVAGVLVFVLVRLRGRR